MAVLTVAKLIAISDALAASMLLAAAGLGSNDLEEPSDDTGARGRLGDLNGVIMAYAQDDYIALSQAIRTGIETAGYETWSAAKLAGACDALESMAGDAGLTGVTSLTSFAAYYNYGTGGAWTSLLAPDFGRGVYYHVNGANLAAKNVYSPAITDMGNRAAGGSFVAGTDVDDTKYAGAAIANLVSTGITGSGLVVVVGDGRDSLGANVTGRSWTATVSGNATTALTPGVAGDILIGVTGITIPGGISAGTLQVACAIPAGRSNPPT